MLRKRSEHLDLWGHMWIRVWECHTQMEYSPTVGCTFRSSQIGMPCFDVLLEGTSTYAHRGYLIVLDFFEISQKSTSTECALLLKKSVSEDVYVAIATSFGDLDALHHSIS